MSVAFDCFTEASNLNSAADQGAAAWDVWGRNYISGLATDRKLLQVRVALGHTNAGWNAYRTGFRDAAEADGFTTSTPPLSPVLASNEFIIAWDNF